MRKYRARGSNNILFAMQCIFLVLLLTLGMSFYAFEASADQEETESQGDFAESSQEEQSLGEESQEEQSEGESSESESSEEESFASEISEEESETSSEGTGIMPLGMPITAGTFAQLRTLMMTAGADYTITLTNDIALESIITVPATTTIELKGNGKKISLGPTFAANRHFLLNGKLTLGAGVTLDGSAPGAPGTPFAGGIDVRATGSFTLDGGTITNCLAQQGGAIDMVLGSKLAISNGTISNCTAKDKGGAIYYKGSTNFTMTGGTIENCTAYQGGGIYIQNNNHATSFTMSGNSKIQNCDAVIGSLASAQGGGVHILTGTFIMEGSSKISGCYAGLQGGAVFALQGTTVILGNAGGTATPVIEDSIAYLKLSFSAANPSNNGHGGAIYMTGGPVTIYPGSTIRNCHSGNNGGAVYATSSGANIASLQIYGGLIDGCTAGNGGAVFLTHANTALFNMYGGTISNCSAYYAGGGIMLSGTSMIMHEKALIDNCLAGNSANAYYRCEGGGIYLGGTSNLTVDGATIQNCTANNYNQTAGLRQRIFGSGGGIFIEGTSQAKLNGAVIKNCTAAQHGGGVFAKDHTTLTTDANVVFTGNKASIYRIPADNIMNGTSGYNCTSASTVSLSAAQLDNRMYPLNNYDINHLSYGAKYKGNGGVDGAMTEYSELFEYAPFLTTENANASVIYTIAPNLRSGNGGKFEFVKTGSTFGVWSNQNVYAPTRAAYAEYGPGTANTTWIIAPATMFHATNQPRLTLEALWQKELTIEKEVLGSSGNRTKPFTIALTIKDADSKAYTHAQNASPFSLKHGEKTAVIKIYEDSIITVEETAVMGYDITYNDGSSSTTTFKDKSLSSYANYDVKIIVENSHRYVPPTMVSLNGTGLPMIIGIIGIAIFFTLNRVIKKRKHSF